MGPLPRLVPFPLLVCLAGAAIGWASGCATSTGAYHRGGPCSAPGCAVRSYGVDPWRGYGWSYGGGWPYGSWAYGPWHRPIWLDPDRPPPHPLHPPHGPDGPPRPPGPRQRWDDDHHHGTRDFERPRTWNRQRPWLRDGHREPGHDWIRDPGPPLRPAPPVWQTPRPGSG